MSAAQTAQTAATQILDTIEGVERSSLSAARNMVDSIDRAVPALGTEGPRQKIIESAFSVADQVIGVTNSVARNVVGSVANALGVGNGTAAK